MMKSFFLFGTLSLAILLPKANAEVDLPSASRKIDQLILGALKENEKKPNPMASDEVLVRRLYLDIVGRIPTQAEALRFIRSNNPDKVSQLIDELIGSDGYVSHYYNYFADLLRIKSRLAAGGQSIAPGMGYEVWIKEALRENKPYNEMVYELVTAHGNSWDNPAVAYYLRDFGMPLDNLAMTTQVFLGTQIVCAQCHDHPFDETTQMDYYHLAAFTAPLSTRNSHPRANTMTDAIRDAAKNAPPKFTERPDMNRAASEILFPLRFNNVILQEDRALRLPHDYQYADAKPRSIVKPMTLMGPDAVISEDTSLPEAFGEWLTSPDNPRFAKVIANRLWKEAFGFGVIEPIDDLKDGRDGSIPELMSYLERLVIDLDFDLQAYLTAVFNTKAYQRAATLEEHTPGAPYHFEGPILRRMSAEQIWDSLVTLTLADPDQPNRNRLLDYEKRIATVKLIGESVYGKHPKRYAHDVINVVKVQKSLTDEIEAATSQMAAAQESGDEAAIREARDAANELRRKLQKQVEKVVYREGIHDQIELASAQGVDDDSFFHEIADLILEDNQRGFDAGMAAIAGDQNDGIIRPIIEAMFAEETAELKREASRKKSQEMKQWGIPEKGPVYTTYVRSWRPMTSRMFRASEIASPAPPGHFLGEFGQSDRELIENASDDASITQALALLNGTAISSIGHRFSVLNRSMKGENFRERLDTIYLAMLSRKPTPTEVAIFREAWEADPESGTTPGIVWTILNTREFLFVQ